VAREDERRVPQGAAERGQGQEHRQRHAFDTGGDRDQAAEDGDHAAEEHRLGAVPQEPGLGALDVTRLDERQPGREGHRAVPAEERADAVEREGADHRARRRPQQHGEQAQPAGARREARERQDRLARDGREEVLQGDGHPGAGRAQGVHEAVDPLDG